MTILLLALTALGTSACAQSVDPRDESAEAVRGVELPPSASAFQREVVAKYEAGERVSFEDYAQAVSDTKDCLVAAGFEIVNEQNVTQGGRPAMTYEAKVPQALADANGDEFFETVFQECWQNNSAVVESLYANETVSLDQMETRLAATKAQYAPLIEQCLRDLGIDKPPGAEDEWWGAAAIEANQSLPGNPDCLTSTGYLDATAAVPGVND